MTKAALLTTAAAALAAYDGTCAGAQSPVEARDVAEALRALLNGAVAKPAAKASAGPTDVLNAQNLGAALKRVLGVVEARSHIPILSTVLLEAKPGTLTLTGTDMDLEYSEQLCGAPELPTFRLCIPAKDLADALRGCTGGVRFEDRTTYPKPGETEPDWSKKDAHGEHLRKPKQADVLLLIEAGGVTTTLKGLDAADFPAMKPAAIKATATFALPTLTDPLSFVRGAISTEETRYYLNGAFMHLANGPTAGDGKRLTFVATDGHRLLKFQRDDAAGFSDDMPARIIPRKTVDWVVKNMADADEIQVDVLGTGMGSADDAPAIRFTTLRGCLTSKCIDGSFPDYMRVIPQPNPEAAKWTVHDAAAATITVKRVMSKSKDKTRAVHLTIRDAQLHARVRDFEGGAAEAFVAGVKVDGAGEIGLNGTYLLDMLALGEMVMRPETAADPILVSWPALPGCLGVMMPLRV